MDGREPHGAANLPEYVLSRIQPYGDSLAQTECWSGKTRTYKEIWTRVHERGRMLREEGLCPGMTVGLCLENGLEYVEFLLGILQCGAVAALYPHAATLRELEHLISLSKPSFVFGQEEKETLRQAMKNFPEVRFCTVEEVAECHSDYRDSGLPAPLCPAELSSPAVLLSSSGSTGLPKAVIITHSNLIWSLYTCSGLFMEKDKPALGLMPFYHAFGLGLMLMALCQGTPFIIMKKFILKEFLSVLKKYKISHLHMVTSLLVRLSSNEVPKDSLKYVRAMFTGAGSVSPKIQLAVLDKLNPEAKMHHSYGMTETTHVVAFGEARQDKPGSPGRILDCIRAKVVGSDGREVSEGAEGELWLQGPLLTPGYLNNPAATEENITRDRWLKTGDLATIDKDGYLFIVDRIKDIIKYQGFQISVSELENVIMEQKGVTEVAVIGVNHATYGEVPKAFVVPDSKSKPTEEEIQQAVARVLSHYKWLRGGVQFMESLPKTASMKINRKLLRSMN